MCRGPFRLRLAIEVRRRRLGPRPRGRDWRRGRLSASSSESVAGSPGAVTAGKAPAVPAGKAPGLGPSSSSPSNPSPKAPAAGGSPTASPAPGAVAPPAPGEAVSQGGDACRGRQRWDLHRAGRDGLQPRVADGAGLGAPRQRPGWAEWPRDPVRGLRRWWRSGSPPGAGAGGGREGTCHRLRVQRRGDIRERERRIPGEEGDPRHRQRGGEPLVL